MGKHSQLAGGKNAVCVSVCVSISLELNMTSCQTNFPHSFCADNVWLDGIGASSTRRIFLGNN